MVAHAFKPSTQEAEAGKSLWIQGQSDQQSKFQDRLQSYKNKTKNKPVLENNNNRTKQKNF